MALKREHLESVLGRYRADEQRSLIACLPREINENDEHRFRAIVGVSEDAALIEPDGTLTAAGRRVSESIVEPLRRPVLVIKENRVTDIFLGPESDFWKADLQQARAVLDRVIPSVGRVEVDNHPGYTWLGTGWLISPQILVTNRHVAREFGQRGSAGFRFRTGLRGLAMQGTVDFLEEYERGSALEFRIETILWIASVREPDVALLQVRPQPGRTLPAPLILAERVEENTKVATIGYPARDSRVPDQDLVKRIFGEVYEKKRLAPGEVKEVQGDDVLHDCATLGGNSGSPVVDLATGAVVGLHYSGLYLEANFAVSATRLRTILADWERGALIQVADIPTPTPVPAPSKVAAPPVSATGRLPLTQLDCGTLRMQVPVEIAVRIGAPSCSPTDVGPWHPAAALAAPAGPSAPVSPEAALDTARHALASNPDVLSVHLGYRFRRGWITDERVLAVTVRQKLSPADLRARGQAPLPDSIAGIPVDVRTGALPEQLVAAGVSLELFEASPGPGKYRMPPHLELRRVKEPMKATFHVSPDAGFPTLKKFLERVSRHMTATMYEWEADHVTDVIVETMQASTDRLKLVTQKKGTRQAIADLENRFLGKLAHVWASVGAGKLIPSAYHIKVASRDGAELWLSSGNWKGSGQPNIDPISDGTNTIGPLRKYNREWHVVIENPTLAKLFESYIEWDFNEAGRVPLEEGLAEPSGPDLFVPEVAFLGELERPEVRYHKPLVINRELDVQPLLTPDSRSDGEPLFIANAIEMVVNARERVYVQNQSFNLLDEGDNAEEFERFMLALVDRQRANIDVRVIFRDPREFNWEDGTTSLHRTLERCKNLGFDTSLIRVQRGLHTKGILVDGSEVMLGSHNLTNAGSLYNRDASLRVRDAEVTRYFEEIFLYDWDVLAKQNADELVGGMRVAGANEDTPVGFRRISLAELLNAN